MKMIGMLMDRVKCSMRLAKTFTRRRGILHHMVHPWTALDRPGRLPAESGRVAEAGRFGAMLDRWQYTGT